MDDQPNTMTRAEAVSNAGGVVLCGGESRRMGRPKAWLPFGNEVLLQRVVRVLSEVVHPVVVVAAVGQNVPPLPAGIQLVRDEVEGRGPLAGLAAGLAALHRTVETIYLSGCDVPLLTPAFVWQMLAGLAESHAAVPEIDGRVHPLAGAYRIEVLSTVRTLLAENRLRMTDLLAAVPTRTLVAPCRSNPFAVMNVNTPEEYADSLRFAEPPSGS